MIYMINSKSMKINLPIISFKDIIKGILQIYMEALRISGGTASPGT